MKLLLAMLLGATTLYAQEKITIPAGTEIPARLASQLDSGQVHVGDLVMMDVLEDLKLQGLIAVPRGAIVMGKVTAAKGARKMGRGGELDVAFETITAADGTKIPVSGEKIEKGKGGYGGGSVVAGAAAGLLFPPAGALLLLKHGHASVIPVGTVMTVHVTAATAVFGEKPKEIVAASAPAPQPSPLSNQFMGTTASDVPEESVAEAARKNRERKAAKTQNP